jgi:Tfp pilus assembly major pilin PilA
VLGLTLPDWIDPDNARTIALVVAGVAIVLAVVVIRFVQKLVVKVAFTAVLALVALVAWTQRADLADCAKTCECKVLGFEVEIPQDQRPASCAPTA